MSIIYKSKRIGKEGKPFTMYKFRTLKNGTDKTQHFAGEDSYLPMGKFLRKTKLDELPQIINVLKGDMAIIGPRPEEERTLNIIPEETRRIILSVKPGLVDLASLYFFDEEQILKQSPDPFKDYWTKIKPIKIMFQTFYIQNKSALLKAYIIWQTIKKILKSFISR